MSPARQSEPSSQESPAPAGPTSLGPETRIPLAWLLGAVTAVGGSVATVGWGRLQAVETTQQAHEVRLTRLESSTAAGEKALEKLDARLERIEGKLDRLAREGRTP